MKLPATVLSKRVLVVEDMPAMRSIVHNMLEEMGFESIIEAEDGELAWQHLQAEPSPKQAEIGLVIADWNMPGMSGVDLLRAIRSFGSTRDLPFLVMTSQGSSSRLAEAQRAGATHFLMKPFNGEQLKEKVLEIFQG